MWAIGLPNFSLRKVPNWLVLLNSMAAYMTKKGLILMILINTKKDPKLKELKDILVLDLMMMNLLFTKLVISSFLQLLRKPSMSTMLANSKLNSSLKLLMDRQQCKDKKFYSTKEFNFYLISYVTQVVWLWATSNGWKISIMSDRVVCKEDGSKRQKKIF